MTTIRRILFFIWFYGLTIPFSISYTLLLPFPRKAMMEAVRFWARVIVFGLRWLGGVRTEIRGLEHLPKGAALIAAKHQSLYDFIGPFAFLPDASFVLKRELLAIPFFGWHASRAGMISIDRQGHAKALKDMVRAAREKVGQGRQIIIFPEGTRKKPGAPPDYKPGVAALYRDLELPCIPMATNSGVHLNAQGLLLRRGIIVFEVLPPIPAGLKRDDFMTQLELGIENASDEMIDAGL